MSLMRAMAVAGEGLSAQRMRMEVITSNLNNVSSTRTAGGGPYRRRLPVFVAEPLATDGKNQQGRALRSVRVDRIVEDPSPLLLRHEPGHPHADAEGMVAYPNVDPTLEMVDMLSAVRSYEAGVTLVRGIREMMSGALQIIS